MKKSILTIYSTICLLGLSFSSCQKEAKKPDEPASSSTPNYTNFKITSLKITAMPFVDGSSASWDISNGPDVYFNITDGTNILFDGRNYHYTDVTSIDLPLAWNFTTAYQITNLNSTQQIEVYDYDTPDADDYIKLVTFKMSDYKSGYPTSITRTNGTLTVVITGVWY